MMVLINLAVIAAVLLIAAAIAFVPFILLWWLGIALLKPQRKWKWISWFFALPTFGLCLVAALTAGFFWLTRPAAVFESNLGFPPPPSVQNLKSSQFVLGDSGSAWLNFTADPAVGRQILSQAPWKPTDNPPTPSGNPPQWWNPPRQPGFDIYEQDLTGHAFSTVETANLWFNLTTGEVWYHWFGID